MSSNDFDTDDVVDQVKLSYETNFWRVDHEWYVNIQQNDRRIDVYTIPFPLTTFSINLNENFPILTTAPHHQTAVFNNVKTLNLIISPFILQPNIQQQTYPNV